VIIRAATDDDRDGIWSVIESAIRSGEVFVIERDVSRDEALAWWWGAGYDVFVAEDAGAIFGTSHVRRNQRGGGAHVANAGYATHPRAAGKGIARALCAHSLEHAKSRGFSAMQFNFVVSTNTNAVHLWQAMGFAIVGTLPGAFVSPTHGAVDVHVMYRTL
jgi:GNAT superfamily N-acetyltransferase